MHILYIQNTHNTYIIHIRTLYIYNAHNTHIIHIHTLHIHTKCTHNTHPLHMHTELFYKVAGHVNYFDGSNHFTMCMNARTSSLVCLV